MWYCIIFLMVNMGILCSLLNLMIFGVFVMLLFGLVSLYNILVGCKFVICIKLIVFLVWLWCVNILFVWVCSGNIWLGCVKFFGFVCGLVVVLMVVMWFCVEIFVVMLCLVLIDIVNVVWFVLLLLIIIGGRVKWLVCVLVRYK